MANKENMHEKILPNLRGATSSNHNHVKNRTPIADGTFIQSDMVEKWNDEKWQREFCFLKEAKMHYIVMGTSITKGKKTKTIYPTQISGGEMEYPHIDIVDMCLRNAEKAGMKVFLGIG